MVSVNKMNEVIAGLRGEPTSTIESYSRVLRKEEILPETRRGGGATPIGSDHMASMLAAIMRGSPSRAADNAREVCGLIAHEWGGGLTEPILTAQLEFLGWEENVTFGQALAWFIDRYADGTIEEFTGGRPIAVEVDRYGPWASIGWVPTGAMLEVLVRSYSEVFSRDAAARMLSLGADGEAHEAVKINFNSPLRYEQKVSYREGDAERNKSAISKNFALADERNKYDLSGSEGISSKTLIALSKLLKL